MPLESPNLDDRSWQQLVESATARIRQDAPDWTDLSPSDPGIVLLEVFAFLTEALIYRLNRVPDKLFIEFLRLIGVRLQPPAAAAVTLVFSREEGVHGPIEIPRGTHVTIARPTSGTEPPIFVTAETATIAANADEAKVLAYHAELIEAESVGAATGDPGLMRTVAKPPIVAPTGDPLDLIVGVEAAPGELKDGDPATEHGGKTYRVWRPVDNFTNLGADAFVYMVDRGAGTIMFAPAARTRVADDGEILDDTSEALAAIPARGRDIRVWYRRGGGPEGNVAAHVLTTIKDPIKAAVDNPKPATGGRAAETLENALIRGPQELHTLSRAVTARDFELVAARATGAVSRAKAVTQAELWAYATPGAVEVFLVPSLTGPTGDGAEPDESVVRAVTAEQLVALQTDIAIDRVKEELDARRPLGTTTLVNWVGYKNVHVRAEIVIHREEDQAEVKRRVDERLHATINPLPTRLNAGGWPFGQSLYASSVYKIILAEPGVRYARGVQLLVDEVPNEAVKTLAADLFQPHTWYAGAGSIVFRSLNDGNGWEAMHRFENETITRIETHPERPGLVAIVTLLGERSSRVSVSRDSGATWTPGDPNAVKIEDIAWMDRDDEPIVLLATDVGLYALAITPGADPVPMLVDEANQDMGFWAVAVSREARGEVSVAVASQEVEGGVYLSSKGGALRTFEKIGLDKRDVRSLAVQRDGPNRYLWAGVSTSGDKEGEGAHSWQLLGEERPLEGWRARGEGWSGGSAFNLAFLGSKVYASSYRSGVLSYDTRLPNPTWQKPGVGSGLPLADINKFDPVETVAAAGTEENGVVMAGGRKGVRRSRNGGVDYDDPSKREFEEEVTLPPTWLLVNGENNITVTTGDG